MPTHVLMPRLGESITEGTIIRWNKAVGDTVERDEPLLEISTDKVDAEIPAPSAGVLVEMRAQVGDTVAVESILALIAQPGEEAAAEPQPTPADETAAAPPTAPARSDRRSRPSPLVRKLAREHHVDLATITGTGPGGRVTKEDVLTQADRLAGSSPDAARVEPMTVMRRTIAERMLASRRTSAHVHTVFDVDFTQVSSLRERRKKSYEQAGAKLTYLSFVAKAVIDAIPEVAVVNASVDGDAIRYGSDVNLGIAVALDGGLIVPVIHRAQDRSLVELSRAIGDLADRARAKRLTPEDVQGGTFTITNPGTFGSLLSMPIISQPQLAILCLGTVEKRPVVIGDTVEVRRRAYLTLGFDHRIIDGAVADRFMAAVKTKLEQFDEGLL